MIPIQRVRVLSGASWPTLIDAAMVAAEIGVSGDASASIVIATADATELAVELARAFARRGMASSVLEAPASTLQAVRALRSTRWMDVKLGMQAQRVDTVSLPEVLSPPRRIVAFTDLTAFDPRDRVICIGIWARFARPLTRLGALASRQRDGLVAEIATAVNPELVLLAASWGGRPLLFATTDQIAAELAGLSLGAVQGDPDLERLGPWEHPLVQHATELDLGVRTPSGMTLQPVWVGGEPGVEAFLRFVDTLAVTIGCSATAWESARGARHNSDGPKPDDPRRIAD